MPSPHNLATWGGGGSPPLSCCSSRKESPGVVAHNVRVRARDPVPLGASSADPPRGLHDFTLPWRGLVSVALRSGADTRLCLWISSSKLPLIGSGHHWHRKSEKSEFSIFLPSVGKKSSWFWLSKAEQRVSRGVSSGRSLCPSGRAGGVKVSDPPTLSTTLSLRRISIQREVYRSPCRHYTL